MLMITILTFLGLSALQNYSLLFSSSDDITLSIDLTDQEEEKNSNEEVKEIFEKVEKKGAEKLKSLLSNSIQTSFFELSSSLPNRFVEVSTPPPEVA